MPSADGDPKAARWLHAPLPVCSWSGDHAAAATSRAIGQQVQTHPRRLIAGACRASFDGRHTMRLQRGSAIRCTTSKCALPMVSLGYLDRDW
jgi:hypothetical protein